MYVIREMEDAIDDCNAGPDVDAGVHAWDEAVAFYTGSLEGKTGAGDGNLLYDLADKRCVNFKTCGENGDSLEGTSNVNDKIFKAFKWGQGKLKNGDCTITWNKGRVVSLMTVPLIQGTLRYAYKQYDKTDNSEKAESEGATFAAAVLPFVHACSKEDAKIIHDNVGAGHTKETNFVAVKKAFERNYDCMGIKCSDVGGIWDDVESKYLDKAAPCGTNTPSTTYVKESDDTNNSGLVIGLSVGGALLAALVAILSFFCSERRAALKEKDLLKQKEELKKEEDAFFDALETMPTLPEELQVEPIPETAGII